jgi:hypothetical protein
MKTSMNYLLELMKTRVLENLSIIRQNEQEIKKILTEPLSHERRIKLNSRRELNQKILMENEESLKIQHLMVSFSSRFKDLPDYSDYLSELNLWQKQLEAQEHEEDTATGSNSWSEADGALNKMQRSGERLKNSDCPDYEIDLKNQSEESLLMLTASGKIAYNRCHPKFNDQGFLDELISYHLTREEYEICASLSRLK